MHSFVRTEHAASALAPDEDDAPELVNDDPDDPDAAADPEEDPEDAPELEPLPVGPELPPPHAATELTIAKPIQRRIVFDEDI